MWQIMQFFSSSAPYFLLCLYSYMGSPWAAVVSELSLLWHGSSTGCSCLCSLSAMEHLFPKLLCQPYPQEYLLPRLILFSFFFSFFFLQIYLFTHLACLLLHILTSFGDSFCLSPHVSPASSGYCPF